MCEKVPDEIKEQIQEHFTRALGLLKNFIAQEIDSIGRARDKRALLRIKGRILYAQVFLMADDTKSCVYCLTGFCCDCSYGERHGYCAQDDSDWGEFDCSKVSLLEDIGKSYELRQEDKDEIRNIYIGGIDNGDREHN